MTRERIALCNVIANTITEALELDPDPASAPTVAEMASRTWDAVDVAASADGTAWTRYEDVTLDAEELAYVIRNAEAQLA